MNQHPKALAMGLPEEHQELTEAGLYQLCNITKLAMQAVNRMNEVGHTPDEMVEIIRELRAIAQQIAGRNFKSPPGRSNGQPYYQDRLANAENLANDIITKTEDFR